MGAFEVTATTTRDGVQVDEISFEVSSEDRGSAYFLQNRTEDARPLVVAFHDGRGSRSDLLGEVETLAAKGHRCLAIDSPRMREAMGVRDHLAALTAAVTVGRAAIDAVRGLPQIDPQRIGLMGRGMGGEAAAVVAIDTTGVRVVAIAGALPRRGRFLASDHAIADAARLMLGDDAVARMVDGLTPLELIPALVAREDITWMLQLGDDDDRFDDDDRRELIYDIPQTVRIARHATWAELGRFHARQERIDLLHRVLR
ncbi:MAG: hypothetical protein AAF567_22610 [Actinomycetota bacterium]